MKTTFQRSLLIHPLIIFAGIIVMVYQTLGLNFVGNAISLLCILSFLVAYFTANRHLHVLEGALLIALGFVLPFFLRSLISFGTRFHWDLIQGLSVSLVTMLAVSAVFSYIGFYVRKGVEALKNQTPSKKAL